MNKQVGIFLDFENLIYGLIDRYGEQGAYERFSMQRILDFANQHGRVRWAWAYADWRIKAVNRFQSELYTRGVELVHVLGRGQKNAVDMKMATDLIESHFTQKGVETFILCSGDRDFLPVLNSLRRYGKSVIGIAPQRAMSVECKRLCTHTLTYESLLDPDLLSSTQSAPSEKQMSDLKGEIVSLVRAYPHGVTGAQLKQLLTQSRNHPFNEKEYGFIKLGDLLNQFEDHLLITRPTQGDLYVQVHQDLEQEEALLLDHQALHIALSALKGYQYNRDAVIRRKILRSIFNISSSQSGMKWSEALPILCEANELSRSQANKYHAILLQSQAFEQVDPSDESPVKQRLMRLIEELSVPESLIRRYEQSILLKVIQHHQHISKETALQVLGLPNDESHLEYVTNILEQIQSSLL
jgi:hypothetical protein